MSRSLVLALISLLALTTPHGSAQQKEKPDAPAQPNEAMVMQVKLKRSQALLEALAKEDYKTLEENAESLVRISDSTAFLRTTRPRSTSSRPRSSGARLWLWPRRRRTKTSTAPPSPIPK